MSESGAKTHESTAAEAADWYARLRGENLSEFDAARFRTWLAGDPARRREFEAIAVLWDGLKAIEISPEVMETQKSIAKRRLKHRQAASPRARTAWAAVFAVFFAVGVFLFVERVGDNRYVTEVGEQRIVPLADGSVVTLNTATELRVHYSASERAVVLVSGQASFEVAKDAARPFVVKAANGQVRAVGTVFDVYKSGNQVKVTLIEGRVAVRSTSRVSPVHEAAAAGADRPFIPGESEVVLNAGEQLAYGDASIAMKPVPADLQRATAWQLRKLDFDDTPLREAIAEANRYSRDQIVLQAPQLESARISGTFEAGRNELFVEGLQSYFRLHVERRPDRRIVLTAPDK